MNVNVNRRYLIYTADINVVNKLIKELRFAYPKAAMLEDKISHKIISIFDEGVTYEYEWFRDLQGRDFATGEYTAIYVDEMFYNSPSYFNFIHFRDWRTPESISSDIRFI